MRIVLLVPSVSELKLVRLRHLVTIPLTTVASPTMIAPFAGCVMDAVARTLAERLVIVVDGQAHLLEVVGALNPVRRLADLLHRGEQHGDQDGNDGNDDEQFD